MKRNLTLREKKELMKASRDLKFKVNDYLIIKKELEVWTLRNKYTGTKKEVFIA